MSAAPPDGGTVTGGGTFFALTSQTVTATENNGYRFFGWKMGGAVVSTSPTFTFTLAGNFALVAEFLQPNSHDFDGDARSDIAWRDTSGNIAIWLMNGTTVTNREQLARRQRSEPMGNRRPARFQRRWLRRPARP